VDVAGCFSLLYERDLGVGLAGSLDVSGRSGSRLCLVVLELEGVSAVKRKEVRGIHGRTQLVSGLLPDAKAKNALVTELGHLGLPALLVVFNIHMNPVLSSSSSISTPCDIILL
jgi:hypothetical protein